MKKILALALIASLCLSACSGTGGESSTSNSNTSTSTRESLTSLSSTVEQSASSSSGTSTTEGTLTLEEIKAIFSDLDAKREEMWYWLEKDYTKIPIDNAPVHKVEDVIVKIKRHEDGFESVYGTAIFAKVTEETLPGFPWSSVEEIKNNILKIHKSIQYSDGLEYIVGENINVATSIFYQFPDGLYFRVTDDYCEAGWKSSYWDYSTIEILENEQNNIVIRMDRHIEEHTGDTSVSRPIKILIKNDSGIWVFD